MCFEKHIFESSPYQRLMAAAQPDVVDLTNVLSDEDEILESGYAPPVPRYSQTEIFSSSQPCNINRLSRSNASQIVMQTKGKRKSFVSYQRDIFGLYWLPPPPSSPNDLNPAIWGKNTDEFGKYLIERGFPLIGKGKWTLCFWLTEDLVAKVPRYATHDNCDLTDKEGETEEEKEARDELNAKYCSYCRYFFERRRDLAMYLYYPTCFAETKLVYICNQGRLYDIYVQERLYGSFTFGGLDATEISKDPNSFMIRIMVSNNPDAKQFAYTKKKKMFTPISDDIVIELDRQWRVCFDFS